MKGLSIAGTAAMFLVGGGILSHGVPWLHHTIETLSVRASEAAGLGGLTKALLPTLLDGVVGVVAGAMVLSIVMLGQRLFAPSRPATSA
jgi:hypothetical protein